MLRQFITFIDYKKLIEIQANQECTRISKNELKTQYKPNQSSKKCKVRKIGKR